MKLSEALMLGSTLGIEIDPWGYDCCFLGISLHATKDGHFRLWDALDRWPWLNKTTKHPHFKEMYPEGLRAEAAVSTLCFEFAGYQQISLEKSVSIIQEMESELIPVLLENAELDKTGENSDTPETIEKAAVAA